MQKNSINKVFLVGHLGGDPESRYTKNGRPIASFSLATNEIWKDKDNGKYEHVEWHNIVVWDKLSDFANQYLYKGQLVYLEGSLRSRRWKDQDNIERKVVEIVCSKITPLEWNKQKK